MISFKNAGMTLKLKKCHFAKATVKFLGHDVGGGMRSPNLEKVEAIISIPEPSTKKLLKSFLGMAGYFRSFIPNYSDIVVSLTDLTKSKCRNLIKFSEREKEAFDKVKLELCKCVDLYAPNYNKSFIIRTDASDRAVGAILSQKDDAGIEYPIAFASAKLSETQRNWSTIAKECYSIVYALKKFDVIVYMSHIDLFTDHSPLQYIVDSMPNSSKLMRWALFLTRYNITVFHIKGKDNLVADFLSRCV